MTRFRKCNRRYAFFTAVTVVLVFVLTAHLYTELVANDLDNHLKV